LAFNCASTFSLLLAAVLAGTSIASGRYEWAAVFASVIAMFTLGQLGALLTGEWLIRCNVANRQKEVPAFTWTIKLIPAAFLAQGLGIQGLIATLFLRRIDWRGISYAIYGPDRIRLLAYKPFDGARQQFDTDHSVM
jgi:hypothetical protein